MKANVRLICSESVIVRESLKEHAVHYEGLSLWRITNHGMATIWKKWCDLHASCAANAIWYDHSGLHVLARRNSGEED